MKINLKFVIAILCVFALVLAAPYLQGISEEKPSPADKPFTLIYKDGTIVEYQSLYQFAEKYDTTVEPASYASVHELFFYYDVEAFYLSPLDFVNNTDGDNIQSSTDLHAQSYIIKSKIVNTTNWYLLAFAITAVFMIVFAAINYSRKKTIIT